MNFNELNIITPLLKALEKEWFSTPTEIQERVIPLAIQKKDILWCARTGSGKTLAYTLPVLHNLYNKRLENWLVEWKIIRKIKSLILIPTRELAIQIWETFAPYSTNTNLKYTVIYGWVNQFHQVKALEKWVDILIATPGRLMDLSAQWFINISFVEIFVLDEVDRMLDTWSLIDIKKIIKRLPKQKQTLFFSATMPDAIIELAKSILQTPETITVHKNSSTTDTIKQKVYIVSRNYKRQLLQQIVKRSDLKSIIVFINTIDECEKVFEFINRTWIPCDYINKNKSQNARQNALKALKNWEIKVLIATDIASRWLDVNDLSCVINYDLPWDSETYVHRVWRTARVWKEWFSISFCTLQEKDKLTSIEKLIWKTLEVIQDDSYKKEVVPQGKSEKTIYLNKKVKRKKSFRTEVWKKDTWKKDTWKAKTWKAKTWKAKT